MVQEPSQITALVVVLNGLARTGHMVKKLIDAFMAETALLTHVDLMVNLIERSEYLGVLLQIKHVNFIYELC